MGRFFDFAAQSGGTIFDLAADEPVVTITGMHFNRSAGTQFELRDGTVVTFPVVSTYRPQAVMMAQDATGRVLAHFRLVRRDVRQICEIVVPPGSLSGDDLLIVLGFGGSMIRQYFDTPGGG